MNSKSYDITGSKYGAVDPTASETIQSIPDSPEPATVNMSQPPKPAVRQRISQAKKEPSSVSINNEPASLIANDQNLPRKLIDDANNKLLPKLEEESPTKGVITLPLPTELPPIDRPYPRKVLFIVANEFCERFSYYGLRTVLVLYFRSVMGLSDSTSTVSFHLFASLCYLTPILGAILGDSIWGKYKTILYLSTVYLLGEITLVTSSVFWDEGLFSTSATFIGLLLIGVGTGGIKPCVSALGGDQFHPHEEKWRLNFFSLFYGAINLGSLISMFLTPMLRSNFSCVNRSDCYPYAFGLPTVLMFLGIIVFLLAKNEYVLVPLPEKNIIIAFCQCTCLALRRRLLGHELPVSTTMPIIKDRGGPQSETTSSSSLSVSDNDDAFVKQAIQKSEARQRSEKEIECRVVSKSSGKEPVIDRSHWLYLASDHYDTQTIEDFRSVWNIMLIFAPTPIYWCLFDQQGSLWTLQATRMDGRVFGTGFVLQPDQMSVANPLLLLASIPVFQVIIYPCLASCNLLTKPIQRMTAGGFLAALTFILSALIELRIQQFIPNELPPVGEASLLVVNGLSDCYISKPLISYVQIPGTETSLSSLINVTNANLPNTASRTSKLDSMTFLNDLQPLGSSSMNLISASQHQLNNYKFKFKLSDGDITLVNSTSKSLTTLMGASAIKPVQCPLNPQADHEFSIGPLPDRSMRLLYLQQGNGKLTYKLFNNSIELPPAGQARVQLLYESFGSSAVAEKREFYLQRMSSGGQIPTSGKDDTKVELKFQASLRDGQVFLSQYLDVPVPSNGLYTIVTNDNLISPATNQKSIYLEPGTRNLMIVHQRDSQNVEINHQVLQDNNYRISLLYQLFPYLLISVSEVMFSITGLEFSYSMAPSNMKSVILGAWSLMTAFGNILTVAVESAHPFSNLAHDFLFYAAIMAIDMLLFAFIGYNYKPYKGQLE